MNENEQITKAQQCADMLVSDIQQAYKASLEIVKPEGRNRRDNALTLYLAECLDMARKLNSRLANLGDE